MMSETPSAAVAGSSVTGEALDSQPKARQRSAAAYLISGQLASGVSLLAGFVATPFLLHLLGPDRYGLIRVIDSWILYLGIGVYCLSLAGGMTVVPLLGRPGRSAVNAHLSTASFLLLAGGALSLALGLCLVPLLPYLAPAPLWLNDERFWGYLVNLGLFALAPCSVFRNLFEGDQKGYRVNFALVVNSLSITLVSLLTAWLGWGVPGQTFAVVVAQAIQYALLYFWARRDYPWLSVVRPDPVKMRLLGRTAGALLLLGALGTVASRVEQLTANFFGGNVELTNYLISQRLFTVGAGQLAAFSAAVWVPFSDLFHRGLLDRFRLHVRSCYQLLCALSFAGAITLIAYDEHFLRLWVGEARYAGDAVALAFGLLLPLGATQAFQGLLMVATGHSRHVMLGTILYCASMVLGCGALGWAFGLVGVAWGAVLANGLLVLCNVAAMRRALHVATTAFVGIYLKSSALAIPVGLFAWWFSHAHPPSWWPTLGLGMLGTFAGYLLCWSFLCLSAAERAEWYARLVALLFRPKRPPAGPVASD